MNFQQMVDELGEVSRLASCELFELWELFPALLRYSSYCGEEFRAALHNEIKQQHEFMKESLQIEEVTETKVIKKKKVIWLDE
jgi:hypothetical protein